MNEDVFNASLRGFLKKVGITSQREIERAVREAVAAGRLKGHEKLPAKMVLTIGGVSLSHEITDCNGHRFITDIGFTQTNYKKKYTGRIG